jgi:hypothetical protein
VFINEMSSLYDGLNLTRVSNYSVAALYHNLATILINSNENFQAISMLQKSIKIFPSYDPALADLALVKLSKLNKLIRIYKFTYDIYEYT